MDSDIGSFRVHLDSLKGFAQHLRDQVDAVQWSADDLAGMAPDLPLGAFAEAYALGDGHCDLAGRMGEVLVKVRHALDFAGWVTAHVATRYESMSLAAAGNMAAVGGGLAAVAPVYSGRATPPAESQATPDVLASFSVPVPPPGGTVYYSAGSGTVPVSVTVEAIET